MIPSDRLSRDAMLEFFDKDIKGKSSQAKRSLAATLTRKHGLTEYPDPARQGAICYSRSECQGKYKRIQPLRSAA